MKFKPSAKNISTASLLLILIANIILGYFSRKYISQVSENNNELYIGYESSKTIKELKSDLYEFESLGRGYIITGEKSYLNNIDIIEAQIKSEQEFLLEKSSGNIEKLKLLQLKYLISSKINFINQTIHIYNTIGEDAALAEIETGKGVRLMDNIDLSLDELSKILKEIMLQNSSIGNMYVQRVNSFVYFFSTGSLIIVLISVFLIFKDINHRNLMQIELRKAKMKAEKNSILKEQFMSNMSHEIRTPMNSVIGFANLLDKTSLDEHQKDYVKTIKSAGENLLTVINDILDFSKIEAGMLKIENIPFRINTVFNSLQKIFNEKAKQKDIELKYKISENIPDMVSGDPVRLSQILTNIIGNAVKFTKTGEVFVKCETDNENDQTITLKFTVKDTGIGIPKDKLEEIFERFQQAEINTSRMFGGTGLGLAITKNLIELQHGKISVESEFGRGSVFYFTITYTKLNEKTPLTSETNNSVTDQTSSMARILLAEDNLMNQKLTKTILNEFGFEVNIAENGAIALDMLKKNNFDIVLMDLQMPIMDGYQTSQIIRNNLNSEIPIIAMTAHVNTGEKEKCIRYGMNDYISKPFKENELYNLILKYLPSEKIILDKNKETLANGLSHPNSLSYIYELSRGNKRFVMEMLELFLEQNANELSEIENAFTTSNHETIRAITHKMRSSVNFVGLSKIEKDLEFMENNSAEKKPLELIKTAFNTVKTECEITQKKIKNEIKKLEQEMNS